MYTLKSIARRGSMLGAAGALLVALIIPSFAYADALNPLTERSLLLSSSAPGYQNSDGAGSTFDDPNAIGENYAPAGSGPNGSKTGETFTFNVSTDSTTVPVKAMSFQYCTEAAGYCQSPGDNTGDARDDLPSARETNAVAHPLGRSDLEVVYGSPVAGTDFQIFVEGVEISDYTGWAMSTQNVEDTDHSGDLSGKDNFITLLTTDASTDLELNSSDQVQIIFNATETQFITNPGSGSFFVKINTYDTDNTSLHIPTVPYAANTNIIDGGVTVANVMTDSIHIITKVLETMSFSVGTQNRDTVDVVADEGPGATHGTCDVIQQLNSNQLQLGNPDAEYSLETDTAWDVYSYWRLSSNSSGGASVYYSGNTLANTVGDEIAEIGATKATSLPGTEQFGLGFVEAGITGDDTFDPVFDDGIGGGLVGTDPRFNTPDLYVLTEETDYDSAAGEITSTPTAQFAFLKSSLTVPVLIAQNGDSVISCDTAKMRYVANIGADTPAGVYTTKINYLAAPQY